MLRIRDVLATCALMMSGQVFAISFVKEQSDDKIH